MIIMALIDFIEKNKNSRKIFGRKEIEIIGKQLKGLMLTQSEKNRLSRDIRPKFDFIKSASSYQEEFEIKKGAEIDKKIREAVELIKQDKLFSKIGKVLLFGSYVEGNPHVNSDIDLAIFIKNVTPKEALELRARLSGRVDEKVDVNVFEVLPEKIQKQILKNNKIVYIKNE